VERLSLTRTEWLVLECKCINIFSWQMFIGPSGVRALPLAAGINVGGHYKGHFFLSPPPPPLSSSLLILPEGVIVGV
jgi:hypothetical protein